ncbi:YfgM family protein [Porticoccus sp.]|uniref:YfgM family protein n=1 Tax=Porticoccus sp. TaxID=2024853 RepID=UPI003F695400
MAEHLSDEEQLDNFKRWFKENGLSTVVVVVLAAGGYFGWDFWKSYSEKTAQSASIIYQQMMDTAMVDPGESLNDSQKDQVSELAVQLKNDYSRTQYARYGAMLLARLAAEEGDLEVAAEQLEWALKGADEGLSLVIKLRLARIEVAQGNIDAGIEMLNVKDPKTMNSAYAEARGDFYLMKGDREAAHTAYLEALQSVAENDNQSRSIIELKLTYVAPASELVPDPTDASLGDS